MPSLATLRELNGMKLDDVMTIDGRMVVRVRQANGKLVWTVQGWVCRSAERVISWINWDKRQVEKMGAHR